MNETEHEPQVENVNGGELVYRATEPEAMHLVEAEDSAPVLEGRMMPYDEWTEIKSRVEGHFLERFAPGALAKTMAERSDRIRVLFEHGLDVLGGQTIAAIEEMREEPDGAYYRASLLDGLPNLLLAGLRRGLYGSSVRYGPVKLDRVRSPRRSEHNPEGLEERTVREGFVKEFSVTTFPQYAGATASIRSLTDDIAAHRLLGDPRYLDLLGNKPTEPQHSEREEPEDQAPEQSRSTQPVHDYLDTEEGEPSWRL
jgi:hypothetical protein